jgi:hypothetical protein
MTSAPDDPLSHHVDEARYSVILAAGLCEALALACDGLAEPQRTGLLAIHREIDARLDAACATLDKAFTEAQALEAAL